MKRGMATEVSEAPVLPNAANTCGTTPVRRSTWGSLKTLYRE